MTTRDRGVCPGLLDRHFGKAGDGSALTPEARRRKRIAERRLKRQQAHAFAAVLAARPMAPPGRKAKP